MLPLIAVVISLGVPVPLATVGEVCILTWIVSVFSSNAQVVHDICMYVIHTIICTICHCYMLHA